MSEPGYIYLLQCATYYKIGCTRTSVQDRLKSVQHGNPIKVSLVHQATTDDPYLAEKFLHLRFSTKRVRNEWFELTTEDVAWFKKIKNISRKYLDRFDLSTPKPPARMLATRLNCQLCGVEFAAEQGKSRKWCSKVCADLRASRAQNERRKLRGEPIRRSYVQRPQIQAKVIYAACVVCQSPLPKGFGPCCSRECAFKKMELSG